jgi:putative tricarboxylic transport membrane protein
MNYYDKITSLVWVGVGVAIVIASTRVSFGSWDQPGPGLLPLLTGIVTVVCASVIFFQSWLNGRGAKQKGEFSWRTVDFRKVLIALASLVLYAFLLNRLGYLITTFFLMYSLLRLIAHLRRYVAISEAALATFLTYALFKLWLEVPLPRGLLGF